MRILVNGDLVYSAAHLPAPTPNAIRLLVGARNTATRWASAFAGNVDEVRLWKYARIQPQVCFDAGRTWSDSGCSGVPFNNAAPSALNGAIDVAAGGSVSGLLQGDDPDGAALTYVMVNPPARGVVTLLSPVTGAFQYKAGNYLNQQDSFTFAVRDQFMQSAAAVMTVNISGFAALDSDADGMPDAFEIAYGLDSAVATDAALDFDRDGATNHDEFLNSSDPTIADEGDERHVLGLSFPEGVGSAPTRDATGFRHTATRTNTQWIAGKQGFGLRVSGSGVITVPDSPALDLTTSLAIEMWVRPTSTGQTAYLAAKILDVDKEFAYSLSLASGALRAQFGVNRYLSTYIVPINVWTHVAVTWDGARVRLYANGVQVYSASRTMNISTNDRPLMLGARSKVGRFAQGFRGDLDQVNVWARSRSGAEVCSESQGLWNGMNCTR